MRNLPKDKTGRVVPWFVEWIDGVPDFRIARREAIWDGIRFDACWLCGRRVSVHKAYVIGPMCAVNRITAEPASHRECARYAVQVCPFLVRPDMRRRPADDVAGTVPAAGGMLLRNPGVSLLWVTRSFDTVSDGKGGTLIEIGPPVRVEWWAEGRAATRAEVLAAIESGLPALRAAADIDGDRGHRVLDREYAKALELVPAS
jgi:hypothetical protein